MFSWVPELNFKTEWVDCISINLCPHLRSAHVPGPHPGAVHCGPQHQRGAQLWDGRPPRGRGDHLQLERQHVPHHQARGQHGRLQETVRHQRQSLMSSPGFLPMAQSTKDSVIPVSTLWKFTCDVMSGLGFLPISRFPSQKLRTIGTGVGNNRETVTISIPWGRCPHSREDNAVWLWLMMPRSRPLIGHPGTLLASDWPVSDWPSSGSCTRPPRRLTTGHYLVTASPDSARAPPACTSSSRPAWPPPLQPAPPPTSPTPHSRWDQEYLGYLNFFSTLPSHHRPWQLKLIHCFICLLLFIKYCMLST